MERKIKWHLSEEKFEEMKEVLRTNGYTTNDFVGSVEIGELSVEFVFRDYDRIKLDYDIFVGGVDRGYGCTLDGGLPYDLADGGVLNETIIERKRNIEEFKAYALKVAEACIDTSSYNVDGITLSAKADSQEFFNWD